MKRIAQCALLSLAVLALSACSGVPRKYQIFRSNTKDYLQAEALPPLRIPPGYSSSSIEDYYPVPNAQGRMAQVSPPLLPPNIDPKLAPPQKSWLEKLIPHAHMPWEAPEGSGKKAAQSSQS